MVFGTKAEELSYLPRSQKAILLLDKVSHISRKEPYVAASFLFLDGFRYPAPILTPQAILDDHDLPCLSIEAISRPWLDREPSNEHQYAIAV
jgi:hypothetical protein